MAGREGEPVMREPEEIDEREHEMPWTGGAVDVAKASGVVCTRVPREGGPGRCGPGSR